MEAEGKHRLLIPGRSIELTVPQSLHGQRLDRVLAQLLPAVSRSYLKKLAKDGLCLLNNRVASPSDLVRSGDRVVLTVAAGIDSPCHPEDGPLDVRYEDEHVLVVNKPVGMVCHPAKGHHTGTLLNRVVAHTWEEISRGWTRPHIVGRLDKKTSGLVLVAKTPRACRQFQRQIDRGEMHRMYLAMVFGAVPDSGEFSGAVSTVVPSGGDSRRPQTKSAHTKYVCRRVFRISSATCISLVHVVLGTGRTHQIRVHFAEAGHFVLGEDTYASCGSTSLPAELLELLETHRGYALHALRLGFVHPVTANLVRVVAPPPPGFLAILRWLHRRARS